MGRFRLRLPEIALVAILAFVALKVGAVLVTRAKHHPKTSANGPLSLVTPYQVVWTAGDHALGLVSGTDSSQTPPEATLPGSVHQTDIFVWDRKTGEVHSRASLAPGSYQVSASPDGAFVSIYGSGISLYKSNKLDAPLLQLPRGVGVPVWARQHLIIVGPQTKAYSLASGALDPIETARIQRFLPAYSPPTPSNLVISPNGKIALVWSNGLSFDPNPQSGYHLKEYTDARLTLIDWQTGKQLMSLPGDGWATASFTNDGKEVVALALTRINRSISRADLAHLKLGSKTLTWSILSSTTPVSPEVERAKFSPDGRLFIEPYDGPGKAGYSIYDTFSGRSLGSIPSQTSDLTLLPRPQFTPDGRYLLNVKQGGVDYADLSGFIASFKN